MGKSEIAATLQADVVAAMKARDKQRLGILRMLQAAVKQLEVDRREELADSDVLQAVASYASKVKDQIKGARESGRQDLLEQAEAELAVVTRYLPAELDDAQLERIITETIAETGAAGPRDMGKVIKSVLPKVVGRADGGRVSAMVKKLLAG